MDAALAEHPSSFAMLPMHHLPGADGMLEKLAARGHAIEAPWNVCGQPQPVAPNASPGDSTKRL